ncbi:MAG: sulfatase activating formylglycine-generating enzyme [Myxococcota bacterium]
MERPLATSKLEFSRGDRIASYEVVDLLDESPLGLTYRAKEVKNGKYVRLTVLRPSIAAVADEAELRATFERSQALQHPGVLQLLSLERHEDTLFYTAEDFEGNTLRSLLHEYKIAGKPFNLKEAAQITSQILEALSACHEHGTILRALRPEHVLVHIRYTGPRQANFVARTRLLTNGLWERIPAGTLAEDEFGRGEAQYMAPELRGFEPTATPRADVYSAGIIFYEMLTGTAPIGTFQRPTQLRPDLPKRVNDIVELAIAGAPEDRYSQASDLQKDITRLFSEPDSNSAMSKGGVTTGIIGLAVGGVALIVAVAVILYAVTTGGTSPKDQAEILRGDILSQTPEVTADEREAILARHPPNMAYIPPGPFVSGRLQFEEPGDYGSEPLAEVVELPAYMIDLFEFPNNPGRMPTGGQSFAEAGVQCESAGKRLCTQPEWEKACKGTLNTVYAYGDFYDEGPDFCGSGGSDLFESGSRAACKSRWGVFDQSGGHREWTATQPEGKTDRALVVGGSRGVPRRGTRCAFSVDENVALNQDAIGFRCCRNADAPMPAPPTEGAPE